MEKFAKFIRIISVAPIMAFVLVTLVYFIVPGAFGLISYILAVLFLTVLPLIAYPLQKILPAFKDKGREGQRNLAMIMAVIGYVAGVVAALCMAETGILLVIYFTYLISGLFILLFNKVFKIRASGHACGVAGPIAVCITILGPLSYIAIAFLALVFWACLALKRHTLSQLFIGSLLPVLAMFLSYLIVLGCF